METLPPSLQDVDLALKNARGNPYGNPPDVACWLRYVFGGRDLSTFLDQATTLEIEDARILISAKALDGSLHLSIDETPTLLVGFCAHRIAKKLTEVHGKTFSAFIAA